MLTEILKYVKRREVAAELERRGVDRVSGESLNRWVRDGKELRPEVERELRKLFGLPQTEEAAPDIPERLNKIEMYLRAMARGLPLSAEDLAVIEAAHHDVAELGRNARRSAEVRPKADRHPPDR